MATNSNRSPLLSLPNELIITISSYVSPDDIVNLSVACKQLHACTIDTLKLHREYHEKYRVCHDRQPLNIPTLLRTVLSDPLVAWHVRALESWGVRPEWKDWRSWSLSHGYHNVNSHRDDEPTDEEYKNWPEPYEDHSGLDETFFSSDELVQYEKTMRDQYCLQDVEVEEWMKRMKAGNDEPLRTMLISCAPWIQKAMFVAYPSWDGIVLQEKHPLTFMCLAIHRIAETPNPVWPLGFQSLTYVAPNNISAVMRHPHEAYYANPFEIVPLFQLPNIKTLSFTLLGYNGNDEEDIYDIEPRSSSVQHLHFHVVDLPWETLRKMINASKTLKTFTGTRKKELVGFLAENYGDSLEWLFECDNAFELQRFPALKRIDSLRLPYFFEDKDCVSKMTNFFTENLPPTIEYITFTTAHISPGEIYSFRTRKAALTGQRDLLLAIVNLINNPRFGALKEICLFNACGSLPSSAPEDEDIPMYQWDEELVSELTAKGVKLHLPGVESWCMSWEKHYKIHPTKFDVLETDPTRERGYG
ncbi:hypothetical protein EJ08DRAFT_694741 [Tothia fuscella]|uniref:F-box domain-containing protein n=1 Tax=Tothia fuscella TaxID=1048955 RepID=A0A9P4NVI6_9PEZI|nr:hypothetical protein EJ08DRAFT_694741 [Tothia fuscella]